MLKTNAKKKICIVLIVSMLFSILPVSAFAEEATDMAWSFDAATGTLTITGTGEMKDYDYYGEGYDERPWGDYLQDIKTVVIEEGITSVTYNAFEDATQLSSVFLSSTIEDIRRGAFKNCLSLTQIELPTALREIDDDAFEGSGLVRLHLPENFVVYDDFAAFTGCSYLQEITVSDNNSNLTAMDGVLFNKDMTKLLCYPIGKAADSYTVPGSVRIIGKHAFQDSSLQNIDLPDNLQEIHYGAFSGCEQLKDLVIPASVVLIKSHAFSLSGLTSITIPAVTELERREGISLSYEVGDIFWACQDLENIYVDEDSILYSSRDGVLYSKDGTELLCYPAGKTASEFIIPNHVTHIANGSIDSCDSLERLIFGENVVYCGGFGTNYHLYEIQLNDGLKSISSMSCLSDNLKEPLYIPASITSIGGQFAAYDDVSVYFHGDAPEVDERFKDSGSELTEDVTLYYIEGKSGWTTPKWNGYNTKTWSGNPEENSNVKITTLNPANGAENVGYNSTNPPLFQITFNTEPARINGEAVQLDESKEPFRIYRAEDDELIYEESTDIDNTNGYSGNITSATGGKTVTIEPTNRHILLEKDTEYYITIGEGYMKFADGSVSPAIEKGDWSFRTKNPDVSIVSDITIKTGDDDTKNAVVTVEWKDSWFDNSSGTYMHDLATAAMALSGASYVESNGKPASDEIQNALAAFGFNFNFIETFNYGVDRTESNNDLVSYSFAAKPVEDNGSMYTLVAVVIKGTSGDEEWYSNFNIGLGNQHKGFQICAEDVMYNLETYVEELGLDSSNAKFLVTGHSRGAAVANLVAKEITDSSFAKARNVYGYTFATPAVAVDKNGSKYNYNNIFNIVNGEDFVTRVPLAHWNYIRYGIDFLLPSRSYYGVGYDAVYNAMSAEYSSLVNKAFEPYNGTQKVDKLITDVISVASNVTEFYTNADPITPDAYFHLLADCMVKNNLAALLSLGGGSLYEAYTPITAFFVANHKLTPRVFGAHSMATYYCWLDSCTAEELFANTATLTTYWFKRATIACPVDVYVYDEGGNLVASVVDETVGANTLAVSVEDGVKTIDMPNDQEYTIKIVATDKGTVTYTIEENKATADGNDVLRTIRFTDIAIESGDELSGEVNDDTYTASKNYALTKNSGTDEETIIYADYDSETTPSSPSSSSGGGFSGTYNYPIEVDKVDGAEIVLSDEYATKGEDVSILVKPDAGKAVDEVIVTDTHGNVLTVTKTGDNQYSFTMPSGKVDVQVTTKDAEYDLRIVMQINNKNILANNTTIVNDVAPVIVGDRTLVPIRVITELLGGSVAWNADTRTVTLKIDGQILSMTIDQEIPGFGTSAIIMNNRTYVPVRYVMEKMGAEVEWIAATRQIIIEK